MRILLTNDDGIHAPGIEALYEAVADPRGIYGGPLGEVVWPVAPLTVQSATSHGVTFHTPLMTSHERVSERMSGVAVDGRPADCVKLAITSLWPERFGEGSRPDLVISGMNAGANVGINIIYSGTVAAAIEAAFLGIPSIAVSLHLGPGLPLFDVAAGHARKVIERLIEDGVGGPGLLRPHTCVNVNIPRCEEAVPDTPEGAERSRAARAKAGLPGPLPGQGPASDGAVDPRAEMPVVVCPMNVHGLEDAYERRENPGGAVYYWSAGSGLAFLSADDGTDVDQLFERRITVTPLRYDLTDHDALGAFADRLST